MNFIEIYIQTGQISLSLAKYLWKYDFKKVPFVKP